MDKCPYCGADGSTKKRVSTFDCFTVIGGGENQTLISHTCKSRQISQLKAKVEELQGHIKKFLDIKKVMMAKSMEMIQTEESLRTELSAVKKSLTVAQEVINKVVNISAHIMYAGLDEEMDHWQTKRDVLIMDELGGYELVREWESTAITEAKDADKK